jgi:hypothetical protein
LAIFPGWRRLIGAVRDDGIGDVACVSAWLAGDRITR